MKHTKIVAGLPKMIADKINKTGYTRGAQPPERVVFQNRVTRNNRAVLPLAVWQARHLPKEGFENGFVIMVRPREYFEEGGLTRRTDFPEDVIIGENAFVFYETRADWEAFPPTELGWVPVVHLVNGQPAKRRSPKGIDQGHYVARAPATTSAEAVVEGSPQGIRHFEYASSETIANTKLQLAWLAWQTEGIDEVVRETGVIDPEPYRAQITSACAARDLLDEERLEASRVLQGGRPVCPLCAEPISATGLMTLVEQQEGREVPDLTVTEVNLFHVVDLCPGQYNHREYQVGWGHYHCNTVARDLGVDATLGWMAEVLARNGYQVRAPDA